MSSNMYNPNFFPRQRILVPKDQERNLIAAFFHMATIALTCTSLAQLGWFRIHGGQCGPHLAVYQFFSFRFNEIQPSTSYPTNEVLPSSATNSYYVPTEYSEFQCITQDVDDLMRLLILLCFMAIITSLIGFFLDIVGPTKRILKIIRRNSIPSLLTVAWVVMIIGICYDITVLLEESIKEDHPDFDVHVSYEYGCYTITAAGALAVVATACNLFRVYPPDDIQRRRLIDEWDDFETFAISGRDTPLESIPPPPYSP